MTIDIHRAIQRVVDSGNQRPIVARIHPIDVAKLPKSFFDGCKKEGLAVHVHPFNQAQHLTLDCQWRPMSTGSTYLYPDFVSS